MKILLQSLFLFLLVTQISFAQWVQTSLDSIDVNCFAESGENLFVGAGFEYYRPSRGVFLSTNNGVSWTSAGLTESLVFSIAVNGNNLFAATYGGVGGVFLSTNNGTSWTQVLTKSIRPLAMSGTNLFAGIDYSGAIPLDSTKYGALLSTDNGTSWSWANAGLYWKHIWALAVSGMNLFAGTEGGGVFLSTDNGTNWTAVNSGLPMPSFVQAFAVSGTNLFAGMLNWDPIDCVFLSTDNGMSWTTASSGLTNTSVNDFAVFGTNIFAGTNAGVFLSTNSGTNWSPVNTSLTDTTVLDLIVKGTNLFAGTEGGGVWRRPLSEMITDVEDIEQAPTEFLLSQNFPNPFNPNTQIKYSIPKSSQVTLKIFNTLGEETKTLVNEEKAVGTYGVTWYAANLPSGIYFYQLKAKEFVQSKKMILLK